MAHIRKQEMIDLIIRLQDTPDYVGRKYKRTILQDKLASEVEAILVSVMGQVHVRELE